MGRSACPNQVRKSIADSAFRCFDPSARNLVSDLVEKHRYNCRSFVEAILDAERVPFTQNEHYLQTSEDNWLTQYKDQRAGQKASEKYKNLIPEPSEPAANGAPALQPPAATNVASTTARADGQGFTFTSLSSQTPFGQSSFSGQKSQPALAPTAQSPGTVENLKKIEAIVALINSSGLGLEATAESLSKLYPPDEYVTELKVMAEVRGYFKVSYKVRGTL